MPTAEEIAAAAAKAASDKIAADRAAAEKIIADAAAAKVASDKAAADKVAADAAAAQKIIDDKAAADALAARTANMTDEAKELLKEQMKTKQRLKEANEEKAGLEAKLKAFEGIDPAKAKEILEAHNAAEALKVAQAKKDLEKAGEFDRLKTMMADEHKKELGAATTEAKTTKTALDQAMQTINDLTVGQSFSNSKFISDDLVLTPRVARDVYGNHFDIENGQVVAYDKPKGAESRTKLVNSSGEALNFEDALKKLVDSAPDKDQLLKSKLKPGARSTTTNERVANRQSSQNEGGELRGMARISAALAKGALKKAAK